MKAILTKRHDENTCRDIDGHRTPIFKDDALRLNIQEEADGVFTTTIRFRFQKANTLRWSSLYALAEVDSVP